MAQVFLLQELGLTGTCICRRSHPSSTGVTSRPRELPGFC